MKNAIYLMILMAILSHYSAESAVPKFDFGDVPDFKIAHIKSNWFKCKNAKIINYDPRVTWNDTQTNLIEYITYDVKFYNCKCENFIENFNESDIRGRE